MIIIPMKKLLLFIAILNVSGLLTAQEFNGGVLAGFDLASERETWPNTPGFYAGIFTNRYFSEHSSFQIELDYIQKGNRNRIDINEADDYRLRMHYLELQLLYHYDIQRITLEVGPSLGWLMAYHEELNDNDIPEDEPFEPIDVSIGIGMYYRINENLQCMLRYSNSIIPVREGETISIWPFFLGDFNEVINFSLYWTFLHFEK